MSYPLSVSLSPEYVDENEAHLVKNRRNSAIVPSLKSSSLSLLSFYDYLRSDSECLHKNNDKVLHLCASGAGCLGWYYCGVARKLRMVFEPKHVRVTATSAAAMGFALFFSSSSAEDLQEKVVNGISAWCEKVDKLGVRSLTHGLAYFQEMMDLYMPENAYQLCSDKLTVSYREFPSMKIQYVSHFRSNQHLKEVLSASICVPGIFAFAPTKVDGSFCIDALTHGRNFTCCSSSIPVRPFSTSSLLEKLTNNHKETGIVGPYSSVHSFNPVVDGKETSAQGYHDTAKWLAKHHSIVKKVLD